MQASKKLNTREAVQYLESIGVPFKRGTLEVWRCKGIGPRYRRVGKKVFYDPTDLEAFAQGQVVETVDTFRG